MAMTAIHNYIRPELNSLIDAGNISLEEAYNRESIFRSVDCKFKKCRVKKFSDPNNAEILSRLLDLNNNSIEIGLPTFIVDTVLSKFSKTGIYSTVEEAFPKLNQIPRMEKRIHKSLLQMLAFRKSMLIECRHFLLEEDSSYPSGIRLKNWFTDYLKIHLGGEAVVPPISQAATKRVFCAN